ncbi:MAG: polysaccharide deacetylase family protein [Cyclobacteriaceae bacterium]|nr:polysaccharide deacetylase family protein [Cyclobacteriaceae bacterium]
MTFFRTPFVLPWLYPSLRWRMPGNTKTIYLTFDDGPVPEVTPWVLEQLRTYQAKATFFCIGDNVQKHPRVLAQVLAEGHAIGNHTFHHVKGWATGTAQYCEEVKACDDALAQHGVGGQTLFRPPYGRITRAQIRQLRTRTVVMWDVLTHDYNAALKAETILRGSLAAVREGSIVVFHDSRKAQKNLQGVLPRFLQQCREQGYAFNAMTW